MFLKSQLTILSWLGSSFVLVWTTNPQPTSSAEDERTTSMRPQSLQGRVGSRRSRARDVTDKRRACWKDEATCKQKQDLTFFVVTRDGSNVVFSVLRLSVTETCSTCHRWLRLASDTSLPVGAGATRQQTSASQRREQTASRTSSTESDTTQESDVTNERFGWRSETSVERIGKVR